MRGTTLFELLIVLVLLALIAGVVGLTLNTARPVAIVNPIRDAIEAARDSAVRTGRAVTITVTWAAVARPVTAFPDGRVVADSALGVEELSGAVHVAH